MNKGKADIHSQKDFLVMCKEFTQYDWKKPLRFEWDFKNRVRSLPMNSLSHIWYDHIAKETGETAADIKCECKLNFGVPILLAEDPEFRSFWNHAIESTCCYEQQLKVMKYVPVTSRMNPAQMSRYLTDVQKSYANNGIVLQAKGDYLKYLENNAHRMLEAVQ